jgi:hypothetical protein
LDFYRHQAAYENTYSMLFYNALMRQAKDYINTITSNYIPDVVISSDPIDIVMLAIDNDIIPKEFIRQAIVIDRMKFQKALSNDLHGKAKKIAKMYGKKPPVKRVRAKITKTTKKIIERIVEQAVNENLSIPQAVALLEKKMAALAVIRARRIARTESVRLMNYANYTAAIEMKVYVRKKWNAIHDKRVRHTHRRLSGQTRELWNPFTTINGSIWYPCDPNAVAEETINCRCALTFVPVRDQDGGIKIYTENQLARIQRSPMAQSGLSF